MRNRRRRHTSLAALALAILAVAATWPLASDPAHLSAVRPTENDFRLNNYFIFWGAHAMLADPLGVHHANMFHPERYTFAYADILLAHSLLMLPVIQAFYNPILTFNVLLIVGLALGGLGFYLLAREITGHPGAAFLGATLWAFNPMHFTRYQQIQLVGDHWMPWMAWALWRWLRPREETGTSSLRWPVAAALFFILNALSGSHNAVFGFILASLMILVLGVPAGRWKSRELVTGAVVFCALCAAVLAPIFWPYLIVEERLAAGRAVSLDLPSGSLRPLESLSARSRFYLWLDGITGWPSSIFNPHGRELKGYAFPGFITLALALVGIAAVVRGDRRDQRIWLYALITFVFLAMGAYGAYALIGNFPVIRLIRVPIRFMLPAGLALAMLAALGAHRLVARTRSPAAGAAVLVVIGLLFAGESTFAPVRTWRYEQQPRPLNAFLAEQPGDFAIVEFPLDPFGYAINMRQVFQSVFHWKRLLVGYSGFQSPENIDLLRRIRDRFPADDCIDELHALDVRFVIVLQDRVEPELLEAVAAQRRLEPAWSHEDWLVYRVLGRSSTEVPGTAPFASSNPAAQKRAAPSQERTKTAGNVRKSGEG